MDTSPNTRNVVTPASTPEHHKRSLSGGLLSKLSFLRASADSTSPEEEDDDEVPADHELSTSLKKQGRFMAVAVQQKTRKRKGSLRKAALLGRGAQREKRELEASPLITSDLYTPPKTATKSPTSPDDDFSLDAGISIGDELSHTTTNTALTTTPTPPTIYTSTTDEDDGLSIPAKPSTQSTALTSDSYFPPALRRHSPYPSTPRKKSPLALSPSLPSPPSADWDYSETEWWGWIILIITWIVFVTGMGSCLGVWSWAWDVGETPYAPPELEDDPTLPIVGYYPALIILTGVMAWVWVVVAWVGMKYFRHAKISGE